MSDDALRAERTDYELVDAGDARRLERFGPYVVDRPAPAATDRRRVPAEWARAELRFDSDGGWTTQPDPWAVEIEGLVLELRTTSSGGLGLYPEHLATCEWLAGQVRTMAHDRQPTVLNLFAHTGLATIVAARAGASVAHVDAARGAVAWARRNAELSLVADPPIRWLVDDASAFVAREARRGRRYDGFVLDPPSFGHGRGRRWQLAEELPALLDGLRAIATDDAFVLLTAHSTGIEGDALAAVITAAFSERRSRVDVSRLSIAASSGASLDLGWSARLAG